MKDAISATIQKGWYRLASLRRNVVLAVPSATATTYDPVTATYVEGTTTREISALVVSVSKSEIAKGSAEAGDLRAYFITPKDTMIHTGCKITDRNRRYNVIEIGTDPTETLTFCRLRV